METWEVYKMALENPKARFRRKSDGAICYFGKGGLVEGVLFKQSDTYKPSTSIHANLYEEWKLVQVSVDFMTAAKAYTEGKTIRCEWSDIKKAMIYNPESPDVIDKFGTMVDQDGCGITVDEIINCKWYIVD